MRCFDPAASANAREVVPELTYVANVDSALRDADLVVLATDWPELVSLDPVAAGSLVRARKIVDGRNRLDPAGWAAAGWTVRAIGRAAQPTATPVVVPDRVDGRRRDRFKARAAALLAST